MPLREGPWRNLFRPRGAAPPSEERRPVGANSSWPELEARVRAVAESRSRRRGIPPDDAEDIAGDACLRLLQLVRAPSGATVANLDAYIRRIVDNLCTEHIRQEKPEWTRLKAAIVETLRGRRGVTGLALWRAESGAVGGYEAWCGRDVEWTARYTECQHDLRGLRRHIQKAAGHDDPRLPDLLAAILDWVATPVPVNVLTYLVFEVRGLEERQRERMEDAERIVPDHGGTEQCVLRRLLVRDIAPAFLRLPARECAAFLLHLEPEVAERLLTAARAAGADSPAACLAERIGITEADLETALDEIPWSDLRIAALLGIAAATPKACQQAVINLRQRALKCIRKSMEEAGTAWEAR